MADDERQGLPSGLPAIATVVIICGAIWVTKKPLESPRPAPSAVTEPAVPEEGKVDAFLWQDPFQAALDHEKDFHRDAKDASSVRWRQCLSKHALRGISVPIHAAVEKIDPNSDGNGGRTGPALQILLVPVPVSPSFEDQEVRLRTRYAVLTALRASGMVPRDAAHLDYVRTPKDLFTPTQPLVFPFEWFTPREFDWKDPGDPVRPQRVLVLWLPDEIFDDTGLAHIAELLRTIDGDTTWPGDLAPKIWQRKCGCCVDLIGPTSSTALLSMLAEITSPEQAQQIFPKPEGAKDRCWLRIYSPWATVSPALLLKEWWGGLGPEEKNQWRKHVGGGVDLAMLDGDPNAVCCAYKIMPSVFKEASVTFIRAIGSDDFLADQIIGELQRRGVDVRSRSKRRGGEVVLVSEWDRHYGRAFPRTFGARMKHGNWADEELPENLRVYAYIKGIDGKLPQPQPAQGETAKDKGETDSRWTYHANLEVPIGCSQLDYARRLAKRLSEESRSVGRSRPRAIGVVGTDVYDKLILLHALREQFGNTLLFTTDLDARLLHREQLRWTRNLIVVSHFGLKLAPGYEEAMYDTGGQREDRPAFPPFRDGYQTALFMACRDAMEHGPQKTPAKKPLHAMDANDLVTVLSQPRVFEIGRAGAVDLSVSQTQDGVPVRLHPPRPQFARWSDVRLHNFQRFILALDGVMLLGTLSWPLTWLIRELLPRDRKTRRQARGSETWRKRYVRGFWLPVAALSLVFAGVILYDHYLNPHGEPFSLVAGMSIWPGLGLWLIAILVGLYSVFHSFEIIESSNLGLRDEFGLTAARQAGTKAPIAPPGGRWRLTRLPPSLQMLWEKLDLDWAEVHGPKPARVPAERLWRWYTRTGSVRRRVYRSLLFSIMFVLIMLVVGFFTNRPFGPYRGMASHMIYVVFAVTLGLLLLFVLFLVIDAIILGLRLVGTFIRYGSSWPEKAAQRWPGARNVPDAALSDWLEINFIARLTEAIGRLLYLPALVLLLAITGRFSYFDRWGYPPSVLLGHVVCALLIVVSALGLRLVARWARRTALDDLKEQRRAVQYRAPKDERKELIGQITDMIKDVRTIKRGAFQSLAESPVVHFLLIPSGGVGLLALLPYVLPS